MSPRGFAHTLTITGWSLPFSWAMILIPGLPLWAVGLFTGGVPMLVLLICAWIFWRF